MVFLFMEHKETKTTRYKGLMCIYLHPAEGLCVFAPLCFCVFVFS